MKMEPTVRTKTLDSLLNKAFVRKKDKYSNPYDEITDKVGIRFVVLLTRDITRIKSVVESHSDWNHSLDRDYQSEKADNPMLFDYQSVHYVVKAARDLDLGKGVTILSGTPCEIQIRTLLQHAYAEVTHDTLYKGGVVAQPCVHRAIAKSMALMETTDDLLVQAKELLAGPDGIMESWECLLKRKFQQLGLASEDYLFDAKNMSFLLDALQVLLAKADSKDFEDFWTQSHHSFVPDRIRLRRKENNLIYRQPTILLLYFLADRYRTSLPKYWPLPPDTLSTIYSDLGLSQVW